MSGAESRSFHDAEISAIACSTSLRLEHVEIVSLVVAVFEALGAEGHAGGDTAGPAPVGHKVRRPDESANGRAVVLLDQASKLLVVAAAADEGPAPLDSLIVLNLLVRVQQVIKQFVQVLAGSRSRRVLATRRRV